MRQRTRSRTSSQPDSETLGPELLKVLLILLITAATNFIVQTLQSSLGNLDNSISFLISLVLFLFLVYVFRVPLKKIAKRRFSWIVVLGVLLILSIGLSNAAFIVALER